MRRSRALRFCGASAVALASAVGVASAWPQGGRSEPPAARAGYSPPRTPWGDPDLQGTWPSGGNEVPFERPESFGTRALLNDQEFAQRSAEMQAAAAGDLDETARASGGVGVTSPPSHWMERGVASRQASLIVDPADGRLPPLTEDGARRAERWRTTNAEDYPYAGPEDLTPYDRCITRGVLGSALPNIYGTGTEIMQIPGAVVLRYEMIHETRIIPLDGRRHAAPALRSYMGDSRGRFEGSTLVVETSNFNGKTGSYGRNGNGNPTSESLQLVERFTPLDARTLQYEVTVTDPKTYTRPWTVRFPLRRDDGYVIYEYACHEGNYAIRNSLKAARERER